jgi:hypothetical protein
MLGVWTINLLIHPAFDHDFPLPLTDWWRLGACHRIPHGKW